MRIAVALICVVASCHKDASQVDGPWTRKQWVAVANELVGKMSIVDPKLEDPDNRVAFAKLVSSDVWRQLDRTSFADPSILDYFGAFKQLYVRVGLGGSMKDLVFLSMYGLDVYGAFLRAGDDFVANLSSVDETRRTRAEGLDKMRIGAAMELCDLLHVVRNAREQERGATLSDLARDKWYTPLSKEALQLILATLDEKLLPAVAADQRAPYQAIRDVVAREHDKRTDPSVTMLTTYQGLGPPLLAPGAITVTSQGGGFSVGFPQWIGSELLAKRVDMKHLDGTVTAQHWITIEGDGIVFESGCFDDKTEADLVAAVDGKAGITATQSTRPGRSFTLKTAEREGRMRLMTIGTRGCFVSAEADAGKLQVEVADAFVASLKPS